MPKHFLMRPNLLVMAFCYCKLLENVLLQSDCLNLTKIRLGKVAVHFEPVVDCSLATFHQQAWRMPRDDVRGDFRLIPHLLMEGWIRGAG